MTDLKKINPLPIGLWPKEDIDKAVDEILKDPMFDCDMIRIGDICIVQWHNHSPKYQTIIDETVIAEGDDLFEVLRKTYC